MRDFHQHKAVQESTDSICLPICLPISAGTTLISPHQLPSPQRVQRAFSFHFRAMHQQGRESGQHHAGSLPFGTSSRCRGVFSQRQREDGFLCANGREGAIPLTCRSVSDRYLGPELLSSGWKDKIKKQNKSNKIYFLRLKQ